MSAVSQLVWLGTGALCRVCPGGVGFPWVFPEVVSVVVPVGDGGAAPGAAAGEGSEGALCPGDPPGFVPRVSLR